MTERPFKETIHNLAIEKSIICNRDMIIPPQTLRTERLKSVNDDVHCSIMTTLRRFKY